MTLSCSSPDLHAGQRWHSCSACAARGASSMGDWEPPGKPLREREPCPSCTAASFLAEENPLGIYGIYSDWIRLAYIHKRQRLLWYCLVGTVRTHLGHIVQKHRSENDFASPIVIPRNCFASYGHTNSKNPKRPTLGPWKRSFNDRRAA